MADLNFLLQGIHNTKNVRNEIINLFTPTPSRMLFSTAYLKSNAILTIDSMLSSYSNPLTFYVGINNGNTSYQALTELFNRNVKIYTIDTGSVNIIYHPKLYIAEYPTSQTKVIIGSANFTGSGLTKNFEGIVTLEMDLNIPRENEFINDIWDSFNTLVSLYPTNITEITSINDIDKLFIEGKLEDERMITRSSSTTSGSSPTSNRISPIVPPVTFRPSTIHAPVT
ncbi:TPA: phospholipase D family protein, partial [Bacillus pacificus]